MFQTVAHQITTCLWWQMDVSNSSTPNHYMSLMTDGCFKQQHTKSLHVSDDRRMFQTATHQITTCLWWQTDVSNSSTPNHYMCLITEGCFKQQHTKSLHVSDNRRMFQTAAHQITTCLWWQMDVSSSSTPSHISYKVTNSLFPGINSIWHAMFCQ